MLPFIASLIFLGGTTKVAPAPLDPLSALEINAARDAIRRSGQFSESVLYPYVGLAEPPKGAESSRPGDASFTNPPKISQPSLPQLFRRTPLAYSPNGIR